MNPEEIKLIGLARTSKKENRQIDFKREFDVASSSDWCEIIKDIIAMANSGGGVILFGVEDDGSYSTFDRKIILEIDSAVMCDKIRAYTNENFSDFKITEIKIKNKSLAALIVFGAPTPIVFTRNGGDITINKKQKPAFLKGSVYFRHGAKSEPADTSDVRNAIDKIINRTRKSWFEGVRKISHIETGEEVLIRKKVAGSASQTLTLAGLLKISEQGQPVTLTYDEFEALKKEYPLEYKDVVAKCKKKKTVSQKQLQNYINSCKKNQNLSINWKTIGKSLSLPFTVPDKYMYKEKVVNDF